MFLKLLTSSTDHKEANKNNPHQMIHTHFERFHKCGLFPQTSSIGDVDATPQKTDIPSSSPSVASEQDVSVHLTLPITFCRCQTSCLIHWSLIESFPE